MKRLTLLAAASAAALTAYPAAAQHHDHGDGAMTMPAPAPTPTPAPQDHQHHDGMEMPGLDMAGPQMAAPAYGSGTARLPQAEGGMHGLHAGLGGDWMLMAHGALWGVYTDQDGPRGDKMAFVESMAMLTAEGRLSDRSKLQLRTMLSLEPLMGARGYPNLFATGETANGVPLVDRQHPHDLFMELSARYDLEIAPGESLFLYGGPVAEPALGPSAFMHRASARYLPLAPITHHWFDSTHITYGVVTAGYSGKAFQLEGSAFRGVEPDEERWGIETPKLDSWSMRASWAPGANWLAQLSYGRLKEPEAQHPGQDEGRFTASVQYGGDGLSAMLAFSNKKRLPGESSTAWLAEANWDLSKHHSLFGRIENVSNDELFGDHSHPLHDQPFRVTRFEAGYAYRVPMGPAQLALGGTVALYDKPAALDPYYGTGLVSPTLFAKLSIGD